MPKFVKYFLVAANLLIICAVGFRLVSSPSESDIVIEDQKNSPLEKKDVSEIAQVNGGEVAAPSKFYGKKIPEYKIRYKALKIRTDFFYFYSALVASKYPEIAKKIAASDYPEKCLSEMYAEVESFSKDQLNSNMALMAENSDFEKFVLSPTKKCVDLIYQTSVDILNPVEQQDLKKINFFVSAEETQKYLKNEEFRQLLSKISPGNILLSDRLNALLSSRKIGPPKKIDSAPKNENSESN